MEGDFKMQVGLCCECGQYVLINQLTHRPFSHLTFRNERCVGDSASNFYDPDVGELAEVLFRTEVVCLPTGEVLCLAL